MQLLNTNCAVFCISVAKQNDALGDLSGNMNTAGHKRVAEAKTATEVDPAGGGGGGSSGSGNSGERIIGMGHQAFSQAHGGKISMGVY
jgi:hypothetical protein